jgi:hypothetical protein
MCEKDFEIYWLAVSVLVLYFFRVICFFLFILYRCPFWSFKECTISQLHGKTFVVFLLCDGRFKINKLSNNLILST